MKRSLIAALFLLFTSSVFTQKDIVSLREELQNELDRLAKIDNNVGLSFSIMFDDKTQVDITAGFSDKENRVPLTSHDRMLAGSTGKLFFAAIALKLIEEGTLDLEEKLLNILIDDEWYKSFPNYDQIRIRDLLNHTSGLPRHLFQKEFIDQFSNNPETPIDPRQAILTIQNMEAVHPCGEAWSYSDTNFILLAIALEKISQQSMYDLIKDQIIETFDLKDTEALIKRSYDDLASGYIGDSNPFQLEKKTLYKGRLIYDPSFEWAGGGFISTPHDLAKLLKCIHESDYLNDDTKRALKSAVSTKTGKESYSGYGLGTFVYNKMDETRYGHSGYFPGYATHVEYSPAYQYSLALQMNYDQNYSKLQEYIYMLENIIQEYMDELDEEKILANFKQQESCWNKGDLNCYMGAYSPVNNILTVSRAGRTYGYEKILKNYQKYFPADKLGELFFDEIENDRLARDLYFTTGRFNLKFENRPELVQGWFSVVCKRIDGEWYLLTDHSS